MKVSLIRQREFVDGMSGELEGVRPTRAWEPHCDRRDDDSEGEEGLDITFMS
jgi:hypothetical protein